MFHIRFPVLVLALFLSPRISAVVPSMRIGKAIWTVLFTAVTIIPTLIQYAVLCIFLCALLQSLAVIDGQSLLDSCQTACIGQEFGDHLRPNDCLAAKQVVAMKCMFMFCSRGSFKNTRTKRVADEGIQHPAVEGVHHEFILCKDLRIHVARAGMDATKKLVLFLHGFPECVQLPSSSVTLVSAFCLKLCSA